MEKRFLVAVYGSLMQGLHNHTYLEDSKLKGTFVTEPIYTLIDLGSYPGLYENGTTSINMEVYEVDEHTLANLDILEGYDETNDDLRFDRNYLRHQILPQLAERWSGCYKTLSRAALIQGETQRLLDYYVAQDVESVSGSVQGTLSVDLLVQCEPERRRALLRHWIVASGFRVPSAKKLQHVVSDALFSAEDAMPCVHWQGAEVRRFQGDLYVMEPLSEHDAGQTFYWGLEEDLSIDSLGLVLKLSLLDDWQEKLSAESAKDMGLTVRFRRGGETILPTGRNKSIPLKQIFQQLAVPPWLRDRIPLLYLGDDLIIVYGVCQVEP